MSNRPKPRNEPSAAPRATAPSGAVQNAIALTQIRVRTPSQFMLFLQGLGPGVVGAPPPLFIEHFILRPLTRFSPSERAWIMGGVGSFLAAVIATRHPRVGLGAELGALAAVVPNVAEATRVRLAMMDVPAAETATPAPAPDGATPPT